MAIGPNWAADTGPFRGPSAHEYQSQRQGRARGARGWGKGPGHETGSQTQFLAPGTKPVTPKPVVPGAPPGAPSYLDSTYFQNLGDEQFKIGGQINSLNQTEAFK